MGILLFVAFLELLFLGTPIAVAIGLPAFLVIWLAELGTPVIAPNFFAGIAKFPLLGVYLGTVLSYAAALVYLTIYELKLKEIFNRVLIWRDSTD